MKVTGPRLDATARITSNGLEVTESYLVEDIGGPPALRLINALSAGGVPQTGQSHSSTSDIQVDDASAALADSDPNKVIVTVTYRRPVVDGNSITNDKGPGGATEVDYGVLEVWTTSTETETGVDIDGKQITVSHTYTKGDRAGTTVTQGANLAVQVPQSGFRLTRIEDASPLENAARFVGFTNISQWNGYKRKMVLCVGIDGRTSDGGLTYEVSYNFAVDIDSWVQTVMFVDPETGTRPDDLVPFESLKYYEVYPSADFSGLNIDLTRSRRGPPRSLSFGALPENYFARLRA